MNLSELKQAVDHAIEMTTEYNVSPDEVDVSVQIDLADGSSRWSNDVVLLYDNDLQASGCVILGQ